MNTQINVSSEAVAVKPQDRMLSRLDHASRLRYAGKLSEAAAELETALADTRKTPYEIEFETRIQLAMMLADVYLMLEAIDKAREMLAEESAFADKVSQIMQNMGTPAQKRAAHGGLLQVRDRATQMALIGREAPEIAVKNWINGEPVTLADLRGRVVLLEFWATWCKPCKEMFPKLNQLYQEETALGLEIVALTRHYMAYRGTAEAASDELKLIRGMVVDSGVAFSVGVAEDERLQTVYGANGLPTMVLIDRRGIVRYAGPGGDDPAFSQKLRQCLEEER
jgi:thiol-disulfide isomerase/thioredoxin